MSMRRGLRHFAAPIFFALLLCFNLGACDKPTTAVVDAPAARISAHNIRIVAVAGPVAVPAAVQTLFRSRLENEIYVNDGFGQGNGSGNDLILTYRFTQYTEGTKGMHWVTDGVDNLKDAALTVEAFYTDASGRTVGHITSGDKLGTGPLGSSIGNAAETAAVGVGNYTKANFK